MQSHLILQPLCLSQQQMTQTRLHSQTVRMLKCKLDQNHPQQHYHSQYHLTP